MQADRLNPREYARRRTKRPWAAAVRGRDRDFWVLSVWLVIVFLLGGGSRADIASLPFLRPLAVLVLGYALCGVTAAQLRENRFLLLLAIGSLALTLAHLVPLPPQIWRSLPGREILVEIDRQAGLGAVWRPLSMAPTATRNAVWALMVPLSVLVLGLRLDAAQRARLLPVVLGIGAVSALLALLQLLGDPNGPLFFYRVTNNGMAVGLFANRNHQAVFLAALLPMLVVAAALRRASGPDVTRDRMLLMAALGGIAFTLPLILVTGSRAGMLVALLAMLGLALIWPHGKARTSAARSPRLGLARVVLLVVPLAVTLVALTVVIGRGVAIDRLLVADTAGEFRITILPHLFALIELYGELGSGIGTFEPVWRTHEPDALLKPTYLNHAHDDWLEVLMTGGVPAAMLLLVAMAGFAIRALRLAGSARADDLGEHLLVGRLGLLVILLLAIASVFDYPLRVPSLACLAVVAALWAATPGPSYESR